MSQVNANQEWLVLAPSANPSHKTTASRTSSMSSVSSVASGHRFLSNVDSHKVHQQNDLRRNDIQDSQAFLQFLRRGE